MEAAIGTGKAFSYFRYSYPWDWNKAKPLGHVFHFTDYLGNGLLGIAK